jgi:hypothetical protein
MMTKKLLIAVAIAFAITNANGAMDHSRHRGMAASSDSSGSDCIRPHFDKVDPPHLSTVAPGSEFSFIVFNIDKPEQVSVTVKKQPVEVSTEFKDPFYVVKGKLPDSLKDTAARIDVKVTSKYTACKAEDGWLLKISGK